jgi:hypothetical protein
MPLTLSVPLMLTPTSIKRSVPEAVWGMVMLVRCVWPLEVLSTTGATGLSDAATIVQGRVDPAVQDIVTDDAPASRPAPTTLLGMVPVTSL